MLQQRSGWGHSGRTLTAQVKSLADSGRPCCCLPPPGAQTLGGGEFGGGVLRLRLRGLRPPHAHRRLAAGDFQRRSSTHDGEVRGWEAPPSGFPRGQKGSRGRGGGWQREGGVVMADRGGVREGEIHHSRVHHPKRLCVPGQLHIQGVCAPGGREGSLCLQVPHLSHSRRVKVLKQIKENKEKHRSRPPPFGASGDGSLSGK